jgi:hypothetical protein
MKVAMGAAGVNSAKSNRQLATVVKNLFLKMVKIYLGF